MPAVPSAIAVATASREDLAMMRFNHMELTLAPGTLTEAFRADVDAFYCGVLGWRSSTVAILGQDAHLLRVDERAEQFILLAESPKPLAAPGYDHLGLLLPTREEVDDLLVRCRAFGDADDRLRLKEYDDLVTGDHVTHAFYVRYLLPLWFDVQCQERAGAPVASRWSYT